MLGEPGAPKVNHESPSKRRREEFQREEEQARLGLRLLALQMAEGPTSQRVGAASRSWSKQANRFSPAPPSESGTGLTAP